jgi:hypothetical protein
LVVAQLAVGQKSLSKEFTLVKVWDRISYPVGLRFAPDHRVFVIGKGGKVHGFFFLLLRRYSPAARNDIRKV